MEMSFAYYQWLLAEKATEFGVRLAVVSDPVADGLKSWTGKEITNEYGDYCSDGTTCKDYPSAICSGADTKCTGAGYKYSSTAMDRIVNRMRTIYPTITTSNVSVEYKYTPLGFVGRPCGPVPSVTVRLQNMQYNFIVLHVLANLIPGTNWSGIITMPGFVATKVGEDLSNRGSCEIDTKGGK